MVPNDSPGLDGLRYCNGVNEFGEDAVASVATVQVGPASCRDGDSKIVLAFIVTVTVTVAVTLTLTFATSVLSLMEHGESVIVIVIVSVHEV